MFKKKTANELLRSLVGSKMNIRDRLARNPEIVSSQRSYHLEMRILKPHALWANFFLAKFRITL